MESNEYDVIILGGGITGMGVLRDSAMRGLRTLLIERSDIATGATGRNHGLLHSGARYAVNDFESARECIKENKILRKIASHCIEETEGLFITLPEDDLSYQKTFVDECHNAGIDARIIDPALARRLEPSVNPELIGAVKVPDGSVDPFRLCAANMMDAKLHGGHVRLHTEVTGFIRESDTIRGVSTQNLLTGEKRDFYATVTVNACGIWGQHVAELAGAYIRMFPSKGTLLIFGHRVNNYVLNRCRKPSNADILVPGDTVSVIGTTSTRIPFEDCDNISALPEEVALLLSEGVKIAPVLSSTRILRAYAGVRPLVCADDDPSGRNISRGIVCIDHETRDGLKGFITITGGKLMTYRLMAEMATDLLCRKLDVIKSCQTANTPLPGSEGLPMKEVVQRIWKVPSIGQKAAVTRMGTSAVRILREDSSKKSLVCECEAVTVGEIMDALDNQEASTLADLRRRTRVGMGTCQGGSCSCRVAGMLARHYGCVDRARKDLVDFVQERWKGQSSVGWGDTLREAEYTQWIYKHVLGL